MASQTTRQALKWIKRILIFYALFTILLHIESQYKLLANGIAVVSSLLGLFVVLAWKFYGVLKSTSIETKIDSLKKAVLITGCDTGFGFNIAKRLGARGFRVFAGCLAPLGSGGLELSCLENVHCLRLDVTQQAEVDAAVGRVTELLGGDELWALINNAGVNKGSELEITLMSKIEEVFGVNLLGSIRMTKAFLPMLRKSKGRVVNVASAAGHLTMPGFVPYSASKCAVTAFSNGLRMETQKFGLSVISVEPWMYKTQLSDPDSVAKHVERQWSNAGDGAKGGSYSAEYARRLGQDTRNLFGWLLNPNIHEVIDVMEDAVISEFPPYHYRPGKWYLNAYLCVMTALPKPIADWIMCRFVFKNH